MRIGRWIALISCALTTVVASAAEVLPEIYQHLNFARLCLDRGNIDATLASSELILLPRIKIFVDERGASSTALTAFNEAQGAWESALDHEVQFETVRLPEQADVTIHYSRSMRRSGQDIGGFAKWTRSVTRGLWGYESRLTADVELRLEQPNGGMMTGPQMRHAAMHELGHLLGLADSSRCGDIMGPLNLCRPTLRLGDGEILALQSVREQAQSMRALALFKM